MSLGRLAQAKAVHGARPARLRRLPLLDAAGDSHVARAKADRRYLRVMTCAHVNQESAGERHFHACRAAAKVSCRLAVWFTRHHTASTTCKTDQSNTDTVLPVVVCQTGSRMTPGSLPPDTPALSLLHFSSVRSDFTFARALPWIP